MSYDPEFRVASVNLQDGGIDADGSRKRLDKTIAALGQERPHVVCLQELTGLRLGSWKIPSWDMSLAKRNGLAAGFAEKAHTAACQHLHHIAGLLDMTAVMGPPVPGPWQPLHTAILVRQGDGIQVAETGPAGAENASWTQAVILVDGVPVEAYSPHFPARTQIEQVRFGQRMANVIFHRGFHAIAAGDYNGISRTEQLSEDELEGMSPHQRPVRMVLDDGPLRADYTVDDILTGTGLVDVAAYLPFACRTPRELMATGSAGNRGDRHYATGEAAKAAVSYRQLVTGGSNHHQTTTVYDRARLVAAEPPGPRD